MKLFNRRKPKPEKQEPHITARPSRARSARSFKAAYPDRLANGFGIFPQSPRDELAKEIGGLIAHSRHGVQNFTNARAYELLLRRHVIGHNGIQLEMNVREQDGRPDKHANELIETAWVQWGKRRNRPTPCGRFSWWAVENQIVTSLSREGNALLRLHRGTRRNGYRFQIEPLPIDLLDFNLTRPLSGGAWVENGIEFNSSGAPVAFHLWNFAFSEGHRPGKRQRIRVPAHEICHVFIPEEIGQALGIPRMSQALRLMNLREKFQLSAMAAANYGAAHMVFFKQEADHSQIKETPDLDEDDIPIEEIEAGTTALLEPGMEPVFNSPKYPEAAVEPFMRHMDQSQAAGLGVSYEALTGDLSRANFSSLRAGKGEERDEWRMLQRAVQEGLHEQIFPEWLDMALLSGKLPLPYSKRDKFDAAEWHPRGWASVNPKEDALANQIEIATHTRSRSEIAAARGRKFNTIIEEQAREEEALKNAGFPIDRPASKEKGTNYDDHAED